MSKSSIVIKNLADTDIAKIVECLIDSFQNYFVKLPSEVDFWERRFHAARVDYRLSFGCFDHEKLVGFIINGIDSHNGKLTAFNTGTGVLEAYRGQKLVDKMYDFAFPLLLENGIEKCMLEVIDQNEKAVRVYERIGFQKERFLRCFYGEIVKTENNFSVREIEISKIVSKIDHYQKYYAWDSALSSVLKGGEMFKTYIIENEVEDSVGYFIINATNNALIQIEAFQDEHWTSVLGSVRDILSTIRINNIDNSRDLIIKTFNNSGLSNHINQYEMMLYL